MPVNENRLTINLYEPFPNTYVSVIEIIISIFPNNPPTKSIITGKTSGRCNADYTYNITYIEPDDELIAMLIDWGDNSTTDWIGPFRSEINISLSHSWSEEGQYMIKVKAKDKLGLESNWSDPLTVSMPKQKYYDYLIKIKVYSSINNKAIMT